MKLFCIKLIKVYQYLSLPIKQSLGQHGCCRYEPTCSNYAIQAFEKYGFFKGIWLSFKRILRCHPWSKTHGHDPLP